MNVQNVDPYTSCKVVDLVTGLAHPYSSTNYPHPRLTNIYSNQNFQRHSLIYLTMPENMAFESQLSNNHEIQ